jgi:hypothetical protein
MATGTWLTHLGFPDFGGAKYWLSVLTDLKNRNASDVFVAGV